MPNTFIFDVLLTLSGQPVRTTCVFIPSRHFTEQQLKSVLGDYFDRFNRIPPDLVLLIGTSAVKLDIANLCMSELVETSLPEFTRSSPRKSISGITQAESGMFEGVDADSQCFASEESIYTIREEGLRSITRLHSPIIWGDDQVHFIKPARTHCGSFIRTANSLLSSSATSFISFWIIRYLTRSTKQIYTDTAGINAIALSAVVMKLQMNPDFVVPEIESFGSHQGLGSFHFGSSSRSLFLISTTTSASLERALIAKAKLSSPVIVTIFSLNANPDGKPSCSLFDMSADYKEKAEDFISYAPDQCPYCRRHIPAVEIGGDQFLLHTSSPKPTLVTIRNTPKWLSSVMQDFVGKKVLCVHRITGSGSLEAKELFVDFEKVFLSEANGTEFPFLHQKLERWISLSMPSTLRHIVYINDPASKALGEWIVTAAKSSNVRIDIRSFHHRELRKRLEDDPSLGDGTLLVVGGVLATGQSMMEVNQLLRDRDSDRTLYLAGMTRTGSHKTLEEIIQNIGYGHSGPKHFPFASIVDIYLPDSRSERMSPWDREERTWMRLDNTLQELQQEEKRWLRDRTRVLSEAKGVGLSDALFLDSMNKKYLYLRKGFAFWPDIDYLNRGCSQADVYFTISAVLYDWRCQHRNVSGGGKAVCIQPSVFFRYSDGIIQASFLRASDGDELNYQFDSALSATMAEFIRTMIDLSDEPRGEALPEFILALLESRLILKPSHIGDVCEKFLEKTNGAQEVSSKVLNSAVRSFLKERVVKSA